MLLSGWAKTVEKLELFKDVKVDDVLLARGSNEAGENVLYFVLAQKSGMFSTKTIERYECHRMHDLEYSDDEKAIRHWLIKNIESDFLFQTINREKEQYLTKWHKSAKRIAKVEFEDSSMNYSVGLKDSATESQVKDFYLHNMFERGLDSSKKT